MGRQRALGLALLLDFGQALFGALDGFANHAFVQLNLLFAGAAAHASSSLASSSRTWFSTGMMKLEGLIVMGGWCGGSRSASRLLVDDEWRWGLVGS